MFKYFALVYTVILIFFACLHQGCSSKSIHDVEGHLLILNTAISEIGTDEIIASKKNQEYAFILTKRPTHLHGTIHSKSVLFSKKVFNLFPIHSKEDKAKYESHKKFQKLLKEQGLIGLKSRLITVYGKGEEQEMFFQEGFDKRIAEANENRDGSIYTYNDSLLCVYDSGNEDLTFVKNSIEQMMAGNHNVSDVFDVFKTLKLFAIIESEEQNELYNHISYYLNPISKLLEPFVSLEVTAADSRIVAKIKQDTIFKNNINELIKSYKQRKVITHGQIQQLLISPSYLYGDSIGKNFNTLFNISRGVITPKQRHLYISEIVRIPAGYRVVIPKNTTIQFENSGAIISYSPINCDGEKGKEVRFISADKSSMGVHVINAVSKSTISNTIFDGFSNLNVGNWYLPSAITFYESPVSISNSVFKNNSCEDGLNIFRSDFTIKNCAFEHTFSDAFDSDFSDGYILSSSFLNIGNDGIDASGSRIEILRCTLENIEDKGISGGEKSSIVAKDLYIKNAAIAITSKDESIVEVSRSTFVHVDLVYCVFEKKKEFGPSQIEAHNIVIDSNKNTYLVERKSSLFIDNHAVTDYSENVKKSLYGIIFGKKTVKPV